ncbi:hypothetical protein Mal52_41110 [Symmachiella dynata]|uniref:Uncharacterized protein n=1 Tax=Symmachiella dynata TaxID=2527995 RepID=A0A517ZT00_9PLAN|nr:hypothetical protein [Symmachiella dynata]QDU45617.1 hypothetical protein Mal52_41110 [Symmachiella dynata]
MIHTKGQWRYSQIHDTSIESLQETIGKLIQGPTWLVTSEENASEIPFGLVAVVPTPSSGEGREAEYTANARLIASAPFLLETCKGVIKALENEEIPRLEIAYLLREALESITSTEESARQAVYLMNVGDDDDSPLFQKENGMSVEVHTPIKLRNKLISLLDGFDEAETIDSMPNGIGFALSFVIEQAMPNGECHLETQNVFGPIEYADTVPVTLFFRLSQFRTLEEKALSNSMTVADLCRSMLHDLTTLEGERKSQLLRDGKAGYDDRSKRGVPFVMSWDSCDDDGNFDDDELEFT